MGTPVRSLLAAAVSVAIVAVASPARADETDSLRSQRTAWPVVFGAAGLAVGGASAYFFMQRSELQDRGDAISKTVPAAQAACDGPFCATDRKEQAATALAIGSAVLSVGLLASAVALFIHERTPRKVVVVPAAGPAVAGAALVTTF